LSIPSAPQIADGVKTGPRPRAFSATRRCLNNVCAPDKVPAQADSLLIFFVMFDRFNLVFSTEIRAFRGFPLGHLRLYSNFTRPLDRRS
jgi:hypothetical protein